MLQILTPQKKMDASSFGMVCAWVLLYNTTASPERSILNDFDITAATPIPVQALLSGKSDLPPHQIEALHQLFTLTLAKDPTARSAGFENLQSLLGSKRYSRTDHLPFNSSVVLMLTQSSGIQQPLLIKSFAMPSPTSLWEFSVFRVLLLPTHATV